MTVDVEMVSGGKRVVVCPGCRRGILDDENATLAESDAGTPVVIHVQCLDDPDDPETLAYWGSSE